MALLGQGPQQEQATNRKRRLKVTLRVKVYTQDLERGKLRQYHRQEQGNGIERSDDLIGQELGRGKRTRKPRNNV